MTDAALVRPAALTGADAVAGAGKLSGSRLSAQASDDQVWKSAHDFEAMAIGQLLEPMFSTVDNSTGPFGGGSAEQTFKPMLVTEIAKEIEQRGGLGLATPIHAQMLQLQEKRS